MKTTIALFVALFTASANAASSRKRTYAVHKSSAVADEKFDPYLGMEQRKLAPYDWNPVKLVQHGSMSMSAAHSMSMSMTEPNGASTVGTVVAACATAGVAMLL